MGGTEISLLLALAIMVVGGLFYSGKLGNFRLKKKGKELKLDIHAPNTNNLLPIPQTSPDININIDNEGFKKEIEDIINGNLDQEDNPLTNAPHTAQVVTNDNWAHSYSRNQAAYPAKWLKEFKYWPSVGRVDNAFGDRNLICTCPTIEDYENE